MQLTRPAERLNIKNSTCMQYFCWIDMFSFTHGFTSLNSVHRFSTNQSFKYIFWERVSIWAAVDQPWVGFVVFFVTSTEKQMSERRQSWRGFSLLHPSHPFCILYPLLKSTPQQIRDFQLSSFSFMCNSMENVAYQGLQCHM